MKKKFKQKPSWSEETNKHYSFITGSVARQTKSTTPTKRTNKILQFLTEGDS